MENPQAYIESRLAQLRDSRAGLLTEGDLTERIFKLLMSKKFRKYASTEKQQAGIREAIRLNVEKNEPIKFGFPFGAYKLWSLEETPEADWAELFTLMYYARWLMPVAQIYKPGVAFDFSSDEVIIERMNNISKEETSRYAETLRNLFDFVARYTPDNLKFSLVPIGDFYSDAEFETDLAGRIEELMAKNGGKFRELSPDDIAGIELNVRLKPGQNSDPLWREKVDVVHHAYYTVKKRRPYLAALDRIAVFPTVLPNYNCIAVGTTKTSIAKFWVGVGALKHRDNSYIETVLSPEQLKASKVVWAPVHLEGLLGKNFARIRVVEM